MIESPLLVSLTSLVRSTAKLPAAALIAPESRLVEDLGIDSLDLVGVFVKIQDEYDVIIDDDDVPALRTIGDLAAFIGKSRGSAAA
jgi:acyl carrier protein